jgi:hypothetical protein
MPKSQALVEGGYAEEIVVLMTGNFWLLDELSYQVTRYFT